MALPPPPGFEEIQRQELSGLFGRMVGARLVFVPAGIAVGAWAAFLDPTPWRRTLLLATIGLLLAFFVAEVVRFRRRGIGRHSVSLNLGVGAVGQAVIALASGGLQSPFLLVMIPLAVLVGVFIAPPLLLAFAGFQVSAILGMALLARGDLGAAVHLEAWGQADASARAWTLAATVAVLVVAGTGAGRAVRLAFDGMVRKALRAQQESLRAHGERTEELSALSAEIAHELKNPLASVKGLAGLLARDLADGKAAERLAVLRREVDRMQGILDEFLNYSRPLVPLALGRVDLLALSREVAALHEGMSQERGIGLEVRGEAVSRCDPRKVRQVLINLVQNALDASPPGAAVEVEVAADREGGAHLAVLDRGPGLDPALAPRVFEAGVTTKPRGSGIGLTVARALARQHGGDLSISARPGGGCAAVLRLPAPAAAGEAA
jgi:signal transduction histidine kinase